MTERGGILEPSGFLIFGEPGPELLHIPKSATVKPKGESMATIGALTVKVNYEMTEVSKQLIRGMVAQVLKEALLDDSARVPFDSKDAVREFIRTEVRSFLAEERGEK